MPENNAIIAQAIKQLAETGKAESIRLAALNKSDAERMVRQELNTEHLTVAIESLAVSTAQAFSELTAKTGELAVTVEKIALNEEHIEKKVLREIEGLKDEYLQTRSDVFAGREKVEMELSDHNKRIVSLELDDARQSGEKINSAKRWKFWTGLLFVCIPTAVAIWLALNNVGVTKGG